MAKNLIIVVLLVIAAGEGTLLGQKKLLIKAKPEETTTAIPSPTGRPRPVILSKGMKLADSPIAQFAYKVAPGAISEETQKVLTGFTIKTQKSTNGDIQVWFTPQRLR